MGYVLTRRQSVRATVVSKWWRLRNLFTGRKSAVIEIRRLDEARIHRGNPGGAGW